MTDKKEATHAASRPADGVPAGWDIRRGNDGEMFVDGPHGGGYFNRGGNLWQRTLYDLANAMLASAPTSATHQKHCSEERPCTPCFSANGQCEDAPTSAQAGERKVWQCPACPSSVEYAGKVAPPCPRCDTTTELDLSAKPTPDAAARASVTQAMLDAGTAAMLAFQKSGDDWTGKPAHAAEAAILAAFALTTPSDAGGDGVPFGHAMFNSKGACVGFRQNHGFGYNFTVADFLNADKIMPDGAPHTGQLVYAGTPPNPGDARLRELARSWLALDARKHSAPTELSGCADELLSLLDGKGDSHG